MKGFSPRSLRRMRDFYRTYENHSALLSRAMKLGWIQNVVIMEADLSMDLREWYMKAAKQFGWSKNELIANIAANAHENIVLAIKNEVSYIVEREEKQAVPQMEDSVTIKHAIYHTLFVMSWDIILEVLRNIWKNNKTMISYIQTKSWSPEVIVWLK